MLTTSGGRFLSTFLVSEFQVGYTLIVLSRFSKENFPKILNVAEQLANIGRKHNATAGQVTLAWILARQPNFIAIPGTKKINVREKGTVVDHRQQLIMNSFGAVSSGELGSQ